MVNYCLCSSVFYLAVIFIGKTSVKKLDRKFCPKTVRERAGTDFWGFGGTRITVCLRYHSFGSLMPDGKQTKRQVDKMTWVPQILLEKIETLKLEFVAFLEAENFLRFLNSSFFSFSALSKFSLNLEPYSTKATFLRLYNNIHKKFVKRLLNILPRLSQ